MKRLYGLVIIFLLVPLIVYTQAIDPTFLSLEFLEINAQAQSKGMGDVGVVGPQFNTHSATNQNPALLIRSHPQVDFHVNYMPWMRVYGLRYFFLEVGGQTTLNDRHAFGLNMKYLSDGALHMPPTGFKTDYVVSMSYAYKFTKKFSAGLSYKLIRNDVLSSDGSIGLSSMAVDAGMHYQTVKSLNSQTDLHWNWGVSLTNVGPRMDLENLFPAMPLNNYLPATLKLGTLWTIEKKVNSRYSFYYNFAYQLDKRLVPLASDEDEDNNGIPDYTEWLVPASMVRSFYDSPDGFRGELGELIHKLGFEYRVEDHHYQYGIALRLGYHQANPQTFNRQFVSAGFALSYRNFYVDLAYVTSMSIDQPLYENTFLFSLGTKKSLPDRN